ncbi:MAG: glycosyltransferase, partial [Chloroflexi bacterium]|nr:glycosyltransferase [Chloroflexota bacterium]
LGDDMIAEPDVIAIHLKDHARYPEENIGVLGRIDWSPEITLTPFLRYLGEPSCSFQFSFTGFDWQNVPIGRMYGSHHSVKRSFFERHGGFDEDFSLPAFDDVELEYRYRLSGFRLTYDPRALVHHLHQYDLASFAERMRMVGTQAVKLYRKFPQCKGFLGIDAPLSEGANETELRSRITRLEEKERKWGVVSRLVSFRGAAGENAAGYNSLRREWHEVLADSYALGVREASLSSNRNAVADAQQANTDMTPVTFAQPIGNPETSVIIPVHGLIQYTRQCLAAIRENTEGRYEVIVVDNASPGEMRSFLRRCSGLRVAELKGNPGFSTSCNRGAMAAHGEYLVFLNNDTIPLPGWLSGLRRALDSDPIVWVAGAKLLYPDNRVQHAGMGFEGAHSHHLHRYAAADDPAVTKTRFVDSVTGACIMIRRDNFWTLGGFDERYRNGFEDVDLCLRAAQRGFKTIYGAESVLYHFESQTPGRFEYEAENAVLFNNRWEVWLKCHLTN